ncbi:MAG: cell division protein ZapA [Gammaproteobacteria bacterium]|nr:cell division protein ZapA [Gammaproteobacteria bacterium]
MSSKGVNITIMGRDLSVNCPPHEQEDLLEAARYLDRNMKEIQKSGKIIGAERCAIMAALNITNDLLKLQKETAGQGKIQERLDSLKERIDDVLREAESA